MNMHSMVFASLDSIPSIYVKVSNNMSGLGESELKMGVLLFNEYKINIS